MPTENAISRRAYKKVKLKESIISGKLTSFERLRVYVWIVSLKQLPFIDQFT